MVNHSLMRLGKAAPKRDLRTLVLSNYTKMLAPAPASCDLTSKMSNIGIMQNDVLGDCTCAAIGHIIQQWTAANGSQIIIPDDEIVSLYEKVGGYTPGHPETDCGAVELDVLRYWQANGVAGHSLAAYATIDTTNAGQLRDSVYYFGATYTGFALPISAQKQDVWDVSCFNNKPGSWGGHAVPIVAYDENFFYCITWGMIKKMTPRFVAKYMDEAYALLSTDWIQTGKSPEGFDLATLQADITCISNS